jgi:general secretion pathway protein M
MLTDALTRLNESIGAMSRRERYAVAAAGVVFGVFIVFQFMIFPVLEAKDGLSEKLVNEKNNLQEYIALQAEYNSIKSKTARLTTGNGDRGETFTLFSFLDKLAGEAGVKDTITYMKPSTAETVNGNVTLSIVEMKLEMVNLGALASYLHKIETSANMVFVKRLSVTKNEGKRTGVDAVMRVETVKG